MHNTMDVVQDSMVNAIPRLTTFDARHEGALLHFFFVCAANRIRDLIRQHKRRPPVGADVDPDAVASDATSPLEQLLDAERMALYESALERLTDDDRQLIMLRFELSYKYADIAVAMDLPTADAARQAVRRAVERLRGGH
jgi:RNA polymerase sigma factor (sigma-70 family)